MKLLVFTEGTIIMHKSAKGFSREEIVKQSLEGKDPTLFDWKEYIPISNSASKLRNWKKQGAEIMYLTSRTIEHEIREIQEVLRKHEFPEGQIFFRKPREQYKDVTERLLPDVLIEDDCESIGGKEEMTYPYIKLELRRRIKAITVREFGGIDHLLDELSKLGEI